MSLVVETGEGLSNAESYVSTADCTTYAAARGLTFTADAAGEQALRRATTWLDNTYRLRFPGQRKKFRLQALEWPRVAVADINGYSVADDAVPVEIIRATCEAAVRELASVGSLSPDVTPGKVKKAVRVEGAVSVEYAVGAGSAQSQQPVVTLIDGILQPLIGAASNAYTATAVRG